MWLQLLQLLNPAGLISQVLDNRKNKRELKSAIQSQRLQNVENGRVSEANWNLEALKQAGWKDEWLTVLVSIPLVLAFFPYAVPAIHAGFAVLATMPPWYQGAIGLVFSAAFGSQAYSKFTQTQFKTKMNKAYTLPKS